MLSAGTVATNAVAGWPDPVAVGLHAAAPLVLLAMIEAGRTVLLRRIGQMQGTVRAPISLSWWLLAPWRSFQLWRRLALWRITNHRTAVDTELQLRRAASLLRVRYGRCWARRTPADLVRMLRTDVAMDEVAPVGATRPRARHQLSVAGLLSSCQRVVPVAEIGPVPGARAAAVAAQPYFDIGDRVRRGALVAGCFRSTSELVMI